MTKTLINSGSTFQYSFTFPLNEPPGVYWYHPHVHGLAERDLLGGATGALIVDGIQDVQPAVQGLPQRLLVVRDQPTIYGAGNESAGTCGNGIPFQDLSVNYVPIVSQQQSNGAVTFTPAVLQMQPGSTEFWRVVNTSADTILDLQVMYDGVPQAFQIVSIDSVPVNSQNGIQPGQLISAAHFRLPEPGRVSRERAGPKREGGAVGHQQYQYGATRGLRSHSSPIQHQLEPRQRDDCFSRRVDAEVYCPEYQPAAVRGSDARV